MKSFVSFVAFFYTHPNEFIYHFRLRLAMILSRFSLEKQRCDHVHILEVCMRCAVVLFWRNKKFNWRKKKTIKAIEILTASFFSRLLFMVGSTKSKTNSHFDVGDLTMTFLFNLRSNCIIDCIQKKQLLRYHINSMRSSLSISGNLLLSSIKKSPILLFDLIWIFGRVFYGIQRKRNKTWRIQIRKGFFPFFSTFSTFLQTGCISNKQKYFLYHYTYQVLNSIGMESNLC